jgi:mannosyl-glycoprotein endo-beta-N-acetylglucosaminidase
MSSFLGLQLNIENVVAKGDIPRLHEFIQYLTDCMHKQCPGSLVIWYDAVTEDGRLDWQNCLTVKNHKFFSDCDGLFTNYSWTVSSTGTLLD